MISKRFIEWLEKGSIYVIRVTFESVKCTICTVKRVDFFSDNRNQVLGAATVDTKRLVRKMDINVTIKAFFHFNVKSHLMNENKKNSEICSEETYNAMRQSGNKNRLRISFPGLDERYSNSEILTTCSVSKSSLLCLKSAWVQLL